MTEDERDELVDNATNAALDLISNTMTVPVDEWLELNNYLMALVRRLEA
jgi:hypothetical protein